MNLGGLSSFSTDEKNVHLVGRNRIVTALIADNDVESRHLLSLGLQLGEEFENRYVKELQGQVNEISIVDNFSSTVESILSSEEIPFLVQAVDFIKKEFGGDLSVNSVVQNREGERNKIDVISDRGDKNPRSFRDRVIKRTLKGFSEDVIFFKIIDGIGGKNEVIEFIESMQTYGTKHAADDDGHFPYFPAKAVIIARGFSPTLNEVLGKYPTRSGKAYIGGTHIINHPYQFSPASMKCFIEIWKWEETAPYPELYFS